MGHFGFSYIGLIFLIMLFVPNIIWAKNQPKGYSAKGENKILVIFERVGQVLVTCTSLIFSDFNIHGTFYWNIILIVAFIFMIMYELWWIRYFKSEKTLKDFYSSFLGVPVAGATLPIIAFFILSIYGKVIWLTISVIILAIGHIGIHLMHKKELKD